MQRITNKNLSDKQEPIVQYVYVEVEKQTPTPEKIIEIKEVRVEVPVDRIVEVERLVEVVAKAEDLQPIHDKCTALDVKVEKVGEAHNNLVHSLIPELEMQHRALVAIKAQRDIDRNRRLMLIKRMRKEQIAHKKIEFKLKLAIGASLLLSVIALVIKL